MPTVLMLGQTYTKEDVQEKPATSIQHAVTIEHPSNEMTLDEVIECLIIPALQGFGYYNVRRSLGYEE